MNQQDYDLLREFVDDSLGRSTNIEDCSRSYGRRSVTWRITTPDKREYYLKRHEDYRHYLNEVRALTEWILHLPKAQWWSVPDVLAVSDELGAVIMTRLPGLVQEATLVKSIPRNDLFELAGRFAKLLHTSQIDLSSATTSRTYANERLDRYLLPAEPYIDKATLKWVDSIVRRSNTWEGLKVVPTHSDFSPRNWIVSEGKAALGIIDWERSLPGYFVEDFQRMIHDDWALEPQLRDAFFSGYGREPTEHEWYQANQVVLINAIGGVSWSISHGDLEFERLNRTVIERLKSLL